VLLSNGKRGSVVCEEYTDIKKARLSVPGELFVRLSSLNL
jgi:hypothetical protein